MNFHICHNNLAVEYGDRGAMLISYFKYWIDYNRKNGKNLINGKTWMYQTLNDIRKSFPQWSIDQLTRSIKNLIDKGVLIRENFNKTAYDRTSWYSFINEDNIFSSSEQKKPSHSVLAQPAEIQNQIRKNPAPIPVYKEYNKSYLDNPPPLTPPLAAKEEEDFSKEKERLQTENPTLTANHRLNSENTPSQNSLPSQTNNTTFVNKNHPDPKYNYQTLNKNESKLSPRKTNENCNERPDNIYYVGSNPSEKEYSSVLSVFQFSFVQIRKLMRFTLDQIQKAIEILSTIKVKSSTFGLLFDILRNPMNYEKKTVVDLQKEKQKEDDKRQEELQFLISQRKKLCEKESNLLRAHQNNLKITIMNPIYQVIRVTHELVELGNDKIYFKDSKFELLWEHLKMKFNIFDICKGF